MKPITTLKTKKQFDRVFNGSVKFVVPAFILFIIKNETDQCHVGYAVSKKNGNAVVRNRIKRRFKEAFKQAVSQVNVQGYDFVVIARKPAIDRDFEALTQDFCFAIQKGIKRVKS
ncbi:MAG: ribonuclease P protein component [Alphaproteobacteria bacterium]